MLPTIRMHLNDVFPLQFQIKDFDETTSDTSAHDLSSATVNLTVYDEFGSKLTDELPCSIIDSTEGWVQVDSFTPPTTGILQLKFYVNDNGSIKKYPSNDDQWINVSV